MTPLFQNKHSYRRKNIIAELSTLRFLNVILLALGQKMNNLSGSTFI